MAENVDNSQRRKSGRPPASAPMPVGALNTIAQEAMAAMMQNPVPIAPIVKRGPGRPRKGEEGKCMYDPKLATDETPSEPAEESAEVVALVRAPVEAQAGEFDPFMDYGDGQQSSEKIEELQQIVADAYPDDFDVQDEPVTKLAARVAAIKAGWAPPAHFTAEETLERAREVLGHELDLESDYEPGWLVVRATEQAVLAVTADGRYGLRGDHDGNFAFTVFGQPGLLNRRANKIVESDVVIRGHDLDALVVAVALASFEFQDAIRGIDRTGDARYDHAKLVLRAFAALPVHTEGEVADESLTMDDIERYANELDSRIPR